jgi:hypothetical protein
MAEPSAETGVASALPDDVRESLSVANVKAVGEQPAVLANIALANAVSHQQQVNSLAMTVLGKVCESIIATQPAEGVVDTAVATFLSRLAAASTPPATS